MARVAVVGGGIAGLAAAYELEGQRQAGKPVDWHLFEASDRFGGTVSTTRVETVEGEYVLEDGPDGWVTEKPWARELADELGLGGEVIPCNEAQRRTLLWLEGRLLPMPDGMRLMVPEEPGALAGSPLFSEAAQRAYAAELVRSEELKAAVPEHDESVASFVRRHFGDEVLTRVAAPLLSGVFGGDVERLSVRAVMPQFVRMEADHGSLIAALQAKSRGTQGRQPTFTSLRRGMGSLVEALVGVLPPDRMHTGARAVDVAQSPKGEWLVRFAGKNAGSCAIGYVPYDQVVLAAPADATRRLLSGVDREAAACIPTEASSAVLVTFCWPAEAAQGFAVPQGFGFLVPPDAHAGLRLLAATFPEQKYPGRAPEGCRVIRTFFSGKTAEGSMHAADGAVVAAAWRELQGILGPLPPPAAELTTVRRWPRSLPQYEVGHLDRMAELWRRVGALGNLYLLGNGYHGLGVPDLIRDARAAARTLAEGLN